MQFYEVYMKPEEASKKMKSQCLNLDRISTLPDHLIEHILTLMPIQDALKTCVLSKRWRYIWHTMPALRFTDDMVKVSSSCRCSTCIQLKKYKLLAAINDVMLLHNGHTKLEFNCIASENEMVSEIDKIMINYLSRGNHVTEMTFINQDVVCKLPVSFYSLPGLESVYFEHCEIELPSNFNGFSRLKCMTFVSVEFTAPMLHRFMLACPLIEDLYLVRSIYIPYINETPLNIYICYCNGNNILNAEWISKCH